MNCICLYNSVILLIIMEWNKQGLLSRVTILSKKIVGNVKNVPTASTLLFVNKLKKRVVIATSVNVCVVLDNQ